MALDDNLKEEEIAGGFEPNSDNETFLADRLNQQVSDRSSLTPNSNKRKSSRLLFIPLILLILSGLALGIYYLFFFKEDTEEQIKKAINNENTGKAKSEEVKVPDTTKTKIQLTIEDISSDKFGKSDTNNRIVVADNYAEREKAFKSENFFYEETPKIRQQYYTKQKIRKAPIKTPSSPKESGIKTEQVKPKIKIKTEEKVKEITKNKESVTTKLPSKTTPKIEKKQDSTPIITKTEEPKIQKPTSFEKSDIKTTIPETGNYAIQLLATPSKEEAEIFLNKLKNKNITNSYISSQKKRDIIWYRVRVGNFKTMQEAQEVAKINGWIQCWIDRLK